MKLGHLWSGRRSKHGKRSRDEGANFGVSLDIGPVMVPCVSSHIRQGGLQLHEIYT